MAAVPVLLWSAWHGQARVFLPLFGAMLLSDLLDGVAARWLRQQTELGARLDSWADLLTWLSLPWCAWWLYPQIVRREFPYLLLALAGYGFATLYGWLKYRRLTSYHTWTGRAAAWLMTISLFLLFLNYSPWPFRAAVFLLLVAELDEILITSVLPHWQADVPSVWHACRDIRKRSSTPSCAAAESAAAISPAKE